MLATTSTKHAHTTDETMEVPVAKRARIESDATEDASRTEPISSPCQNDTDSRASTDIDDEKNVEPEPEINFDGRRLEVWWEFGDIKYDTRAIFPSISFLFVMC